MKAKLTLATVVVLLLVAGAFFYFKFLPQKQESATVPTQGTAQMPAVTADGVSDVPEMIVNDDTAMSESEVLEIEVTGKSFEFTPSVLTLTAGQKVRLTFTSTNGIHDFVVEGANIKTKQVTTGKSDTIEFTVPETPGTYTFYCSVANHRALGMEGELIVEGGDS